MLVWAFKNIFTIFTPLFFNSAITGQNVMHIILPEVAMTSRSGCFAIVQTNGHTHTHTQTDRQTDGHGNSMTDPVKRAESVKIEKS